MEKKIKSLLIEMVNELDNRAMLSEFEEKWLEEVQESID